MISAWNLLWIVPLAGTIGGVAVAVFAVGKESEDE